ncbi:hypothetical protein Vadar_025128 [Vaccinium darrowii]|uniref:Uncharacterized protein n=1 Tax=Vaccinium darrowii TaxID=229202 RepID=A0ACB7YQN0_9ERIC|nr:hypothetical protein Vadar_025128 [Vaccinium darrowii]
MKVMDPEASVLEGDFQSRSSCRKLDFDNDGNFLEINVVSGDEGDQNGVQNSTPTVNDIARLIDGRRYEELKADFKATQSIPSLSFPVQILWHAASVYTPKVFELFRAELCKAWDCNMDEWTEDGTVTTYKITPYRKSHHHIVTYDSTEVDNECKIWEYNTYLFFSSIPKDPTTMRGRRCKELCRLHTHLPTRVAETEMAYGIVVDGLNKILEEVEASLTEVETDEGVETNETFLGSQNGVF